MRRSVFFNFAMILPPFYLPRTCLTPLAAAYRRRYSSTGSQIIEIIHALFTDDDARDTFPAPGYPALPAGMRWNPWYSNTPPHEGSFHYRKEGCFPHSGSNRTLKESSVLSEPSAYVASKPPDPYQLGHAPRTRIASRFNIFF